MGQLPPWSLLGEKGWNKGWEVREGKAEGDGGEERREEEKGKAKEKIKAQRKAQHYSSVSGCIQVQRPPPAPYIDPLLLFQKDAGRDPLAGATERPGGDVGCHQPRSPCTPPQRPGCRDKAQSCGTRPGCASCRLRGSCKEQGQFTSQRNSGCSPRERRVLSLQPCQAVGPAGHCWAPLATPSSWHCTFLRLNLGDASRVAPRPLVPPGCSKLILWQKNPPRMGRISPSQVLGWGRKVPTQPAPSSPHGVLFPSRQTRGEAG